MNPKLKSLLQGIILGILCAVLAMCINARACEPEPEPEPEPVTVVVWGEI